MAIHFKTLLDAVNAFRDGKTVYWSSANYVIADWGKGDRKNLVVKCLSNNHAIGLYHADGIGSEHDAKDLFTL